jgi:hypothetical protein
MTKEPRIIKVRIDLSSIQRNPKASQTVSHLPAKVVYDIEGTVWEVNTEIPVIKIKQETPTVEWFYEYVDTDVACLHCGAVVKHTALFEDTFFQTKGEDVEELRCFCCPKCASDLNCVLEFENIESIVYAVFS